MEVEPGNEASVKLEPGNEASVKLEPGNEASVKVEPGNEASVKLEPGNEASVKVEPGNEASVKVEPGNEASVCIHVCSVSTSFHTPFCLLLFHHLSCSYSHCSVHVCSPFHLVAVTLPMNWGMLPAVGLTSTVTGSQSSCAKRGWSTPGSCSCWSAGLQELSPVNRYIGPMIVGVPSDIKR